MFLEFNFIHHKLRVNQLISWSWAGPRRDWLQGDGRGQLVSLLAAAPREAEIASALGEVASGSRVPWGFPGSSKSPLELQSREVRQTFYSDEFTREV